MLQEMLLLMTTLLEEMLASGPMKRRGAGEGDLETGETTEEVEEGREDEASEANSEEEKICKIALNKALPYLVTVIQSPILKTDFWSISSQNLRWMCL